MFLPPPRTWLTACFALTPLQQSIRWLPSRTGAQVAIAPHTLAQHSMQRSRSRRWHGKPKKFLRLSANTHALFHTSVSSIPHYHGWAHLSIFVAWKDLPQCFWYPIPRVLFIINTNLSSTAAQQNYCIQNILYIFTYWFGFGLFWVLVLVFNSFLSTNNVIKNYVTLIPKKK